MDPSAVCGLLLCLRDAFFFFGSEDGGMIGDSRVEGVIEGLESESISGPGAGKDGTMEA